MMPYKSSHLGGEEYHRSVGKEETHRAGTLESGDKKVYLLSFSSFFYFVVVVVLGCWCLFVARAWLWRSDA